MNDYIVHADGTIGLLDGAQVVSCADPSVFDHGDSIDDLIATGLVHVRIVWGIPT